MKKPKAKRVDLDQAERFLRRYDSQFSRRALRAKNRQRAAQIVLKKLGR